MSEEQTTEQPIADPGEPLREPGASPAQERSLVRRGVAYTLIGGAFWGLSGTCSGVLMDTFGIQPLWLVCVRMFFAGILLCLLAEFQQRGSVRNVFRGRSIVAQMLVTTFCGLMLNSIAYLSCIHATDSGTATILQSLNIPIILFWVCLRARRLPRSKEWIGLVLALVGVVLIATHGDLSSLHMSPEGLAWGLVCATGAAVAGVGNRRVLAEKGSVPVMGVEMLMIGIAMGLLLQPWAQWPAFDASGWGLFAFTIICGSAAAFGLFYAGLRILGAYRANLLGTIEPVTACVASVVWLGVAFSPAEVVGFVAILIMVVITG